MMSSGLDSDRYSSVTYCLEMSFKVLYGLDVYHCQVSLQHGFLFLCLWFFNMFTCHLDDLVIVLTGISEIVIYRHSSTGTVSGESGLRCPL